MNPNRFKLLIGVATVLFIMLVWHFISGWGLVTVHVADQPLAKVIRSIENQGGIKIVTNADLTAPVTMDVDRVPPVEAVDTLATWFDGNWNVSYAAGATKPDVIAAVAALQEGGRRDRNTDFARFGGGGGGGGPGGWGGGGGGDTVIDVRKVAWKVSPSDKPDLQSYLNQLSQKTGLSVIVPQTWNPAISSPPKGGPAGSAVENLVKAAKGQYQEVFVLRIQTEQVADNNQGGGQGDRGPRTDGGFGGGPGGGRGNFNPDWAKEREDARLALLPAAEREQVQKERDEMRATFEKIRALPDADRRVAMDKLMEDPAMQERMQQRMMTNDAKRSPEKRAERFRQYIERKQQAKQAKSGPQN